MGGYGRGVANDVDATNPDFPVLRFAAMLKAARDFGLDQRVVDAIAVGFDARRPDVARVADALAEAVLAHRALELPDAA
jgi:hypothetical protein